MLNFPVVPLKTTLVPSTGTAAASGTAPIFSWLM
jgi:hypothetical protein